MYGCGHFLPGVVIVAFLKHTLDRAWRETREILMNKDMLTFAFRYENNHKRSVLMAKMACCQISPKGMIDIYFPLNLLARVISCRSVQPFSEKAWWAAAGGWWLTWEKVAAKTETLL